MEPALLAPIALYAVVSTATPGPNNIMLAASGLAFGMRRTMPQMLGISLGCAAMLILCGLGLGVIFQAVPALRWLLRIVGAAYLLWLAAKLWRTTDIAKGNSGRPLTIWQSTIFQFVNPKAWATLAPSIAAFTVPNRPLAPQLALIVLVFVAVALPCNAAWAGMGAGARGLLESERAMIVFVRIMAVLTGLTALLFLI